jgi:hypothetical protein
MTITKSLISRLSLVLPLLASGFAVSIAAAQTFTTLHSFTGADGEHRERPSCKPPMETLWDNPWPQRQLPQHERRLRHDLQDDSARRADNAVYLLCPKWLHGRQSPVWRIGPGHERGPLRNDRVRPGPGGGTVFK